MHEIEALFGDQAKLAKHLLTALDHTNNDGSHDLSHLRRVWHNARSIAAAEPGANQAILTAAVILHDCVAVEKNAPERAQASQLAAAKARTILTNLGWPPSDMEATAHAIEAHSFSANIPPRTLEARIVQDADRLDAIGAIGIARCFYVAGRMGSRLYDPADPSAKRRKHDDRTYALDHFAVKLFKTAQHFQTNTGQRLANLRCETMQSFVQALLNEIDGESK